MQNVTLELVDGPEETRDADGWEHYAYTVELRRGDQSMTVPWRQGMLLTQDPDAESVLESLLSDAAAIENAAGDFTAWADEYGFDSDSRKAEAIYRQAAEQTEQLRALLGDDFDAAVFPPGVDVDQETIARRLARGLDLRTGLELEDEDDER